MDCVLTMPKMENITVKEEIIEESLVADIDNPQDTSMKDEVESEITTKDEPLEHVLIKSESNREDCDPVLRNVKIENEFEEFDEPDQIPVEDIDTILHEETNVKKELVGCNDQNESMESESGNDSATPAETHDGIDEKPFKCEVCEKGFFDEAIKNTHVGVHFGQQPVPCRVCGRQFERKQHYLDHYGTHSENKYQFTCTICHKTFSSENNLQKHLSNTHVIEALEPFLGNSSTSASSGEVPGKLYRCRFCSDVLSSRSALIGHESVHTGKKVHQCPVCWKNCEKVSELERHARSHSGLKPFECPVCSKKFVQKEALKNHEAAIHRKERTYKCTQCPQTFAYHPGLLRHLNIHKGGAPFKCKVCPKSFATKQYLKDHQSTHSGETPFSCPICSKGFRRNANLNSHMIYHREVLPFNCTTCSRGFARKSDLSKHEMSHSEIKSFRCSVCSKYFKYQNNLKSHEITHGAAKVSCSICGMPIKDKRYLAQHELSHSAERPFECEICKKTFLKKTNLTRHMRQHSKTESK